MICLSGGKTFSHVQVHQRSLLRIEAMSWRWLSLPCAAEVPISRTPDILYQLTKYTNNIASNITLKKVKAECIKPKFSLRNQNF